MKGRKKKEKKVINDRGETMELDAIAKVERLATEVAKQAMQVGAEIYPEDEFLLYLYAEDAIAPKKAIDIPHELAARMYVLWTEDFVGHVGDKVFLTKKGLYVVELLKMKLRGDPRWKKYK